MPDLFLTYLANFFPVFVTFWEAFFIYFFFRAAFFGGDLLAGLNAAFGMVFFFWYLIILAPILFLFKMGLADDQRLSN